MLAISQVGGAFWGQICHAWGRSRPWIILLLVPLLLTGCVDYDVGINFESQTHGEIVQHIQISERLKAFSSSTSEAWLDSIRRRTRQLRGKVKRISEREIAVTIPFNNGEELVEKFNQFFNPVEQKKARSQPDSLGEFPQISSKMSLQQKNFLLAIYNQLSYDLDLRSLGAISSSGSVLVSPGALLNLNFALNTPWGAQTLSPPGETLAPEIGDGGRQLRWKLHPGELNHLEVGFWVPSPIGIGALLISLLVAFGIFVKDLLFPLLGIGKKRPRPTPPSPPETGNVGS